MGLLLATVDVPSAADRIGSLEAFLSWAICGRLRFGKRTLCNLSWSVQPYVRPVDAAHAKAAGHNALR